MMVLVFVIMLVAAIALCYMFPLFALFALILVFGACAILPLFDPPATRGRSRPR